ncbi:c-di-GMP-binding flagellar brake protein YcgR [Natranaerovirga hydrolytica]|uniref:C-di-GMP-binding flagellar brake protein YcgR n=1 Tax=Natranaerovirga hydrolytica TaxID=680378 RepID=A0A4R1MZC6_9FIRM|nr:PilZ domain-containing protein [Natranaerovirga hydrolytica]TCK97912.1 c-di-GMP-binding flagellar brake protein YcgR [Natranaerovirga hydrolytica]
MLSKTIKLGNKIDITKTDYFLREEIKSHIFVSQLLDILENNVVNVAAPIEAGKLVPLHVDEEYILCFYTEKGLFKCHGKVFNRYSKENQHIIQIEILSELEKYQRRQYYRMDLVLPMKYKIKEDKWKDSFILDLSGGGIRMIGKNKLELNQSIRCTFDLEFQEEVKTVLVKGNVLTSDRVTKNDQTQYEHRVEFLDITSDTQETIIKYIFEKEREKRKQEKGMV